MNMFAQIDVPGLNYVPEKYRGAVILAVLLSPYLTRAYHALASGGGLRGIVNAIWFGTNTPKESSREGAKEAKDL